MIKALKYWTIALITDGACAACFYLWQVECVAGAGNVFLFWTWFSIVIRMLIGLTCNKTTFAKNPRPRGFFAYHVITEVLIIGALAWIGYLCTAGFFVLAFLMFEAARVTEQKKAKP